MLVNVTRMPHVHDHSFSEANKMYSPADGTKPQEITRFHSIDLSGQVFFFILLGLTKLL